MRVEKKPNITSGMVKKKHRLRKHLKDNNEFPDSSDEGGGEGTLCQHVNKAINLSLVKKAIKNHGVTGECMNCKCDGKNKGSQDKDSDLNIDVTVWICLSCGNQGCDRNSKDKHALKHFETPRSNAHDLCFNITTGLVWCYSCDNEVAYDVSKKMVECLEFIKKQVGVPPQQSSGKKSSAQNKLQEQHIEENFIQDNKEEKQNQDQQNKSKASVVITTQQLSLNLPKVKGLNNLGNTCFFNAVMQNLSQTPILVTLLNERVEKGSRLQLFGRQLSDSSANSTDSEESANNSGSEDESRKKSLTELNPLNLTLGDGGALTSSLLSFMKDMHNWPAKGHVVTPSSLFGQVCKKAPRFKGFQQQDSHELLRCLLDSMKAEEVKRSQVSILNAFSLPANINTRHVDEETRNKVKGYGMQVKHTFIDSIFGGVFISTVQCEECEMPSQILEPFLDISLPVMEEKTIRPGNLGKKKSNKDVNVAVKAMDETPVPPSKPSKHMTKKEKKKSKKEAKQKRKKRLSESRASVSAGDLTAEKTPGVEKIEAEDCELSKSSSSDNEAVEEAVEAKEDANLDHDIMSSKDDSPITHTFPENNSDNSLKPSIENCAENEVRHQDTDNNIANISNSDGNVTDSDADVEDNVDTSRLTPLENKDEAMDSLEYFENKNAGGMVNGTIDTESSKANLKEQIEKINSGINFNNQDLQLNKKLQNIASDLKNLNLNTNISVNKHCKRDSDNSSVLNDIKLKQDYTENGQIKNKSNSRKCLPNRTLDNCTLNNNTNFLSLAQNNKCKSLSCNAKIHSKKMVEKLTIVARREALKSLSGERYHPDSKECSVQSCLNQFTSAELLTGNNKFGCDFCTKQKKCKAQKDGKVEKVYTNASKQLLIFCPPAVLTLHMKRFQQVGISLRKVNRHVDFPLILDLAPYCSSLSQGVKPEQNKVLYSLYGIVEHSGRLTGGHYTAYVKVRPNSSQNVKAFLHHESLQSLKLDKVLMKNFEAMKFSAEDVYMNGEVNGDYEGAVGGVDQSVLGSNHKENGVEENEVTAPRGKWYYISDSRVAEANEASVLRCQAYLLFYERIL